MNSVLRLRIPYRLSLSLQTPSCRHASSTRKNIPSRRSRGRGSQSGHQDRESASQGRKDHKDGSFIPLADSTRITQSQLQGSTITPKERKVFERLFRNVLDKAQSEADKDGGAQDKEVTDGGIASQPADLSSSLEAYPAALRGIALGTAEKLEYYKYRSKLQDGMEDDDRAIKGSEHNKSKEAEVKARNSATIQQFKDAVEEAKTDAELWQILESDIFDKISAPKHAEAAADSTTESTNMLPKDSQPLLKTLNEKTNKSRELREQFSSTKSLDLLHEIEPTYPDLLLVAAQTLRSKFAASPLVFSILPRVKQLGDASYALGATNGLYQELIAATWSTTGDLQLINEILEEMDQGGFDFDEKILMLLKHIKREYRSNSRKGLTLVISKLVLMRQSFVKFMWWKRLIQERLEAEALRQANLRIREHTM